MKALTNIPLFLDYCQKICGAARSGYQSIKTFIIFKGKNNIWRALSSLINRWWSQAWNDVSLHFKISFFLVYLVWNNWIYIRELEGKCVTYAIKKNITQNWKVFVFVLVNDFFYKLVLLFMFFHRKNDLKEEMSNF